MNLVYVLVPFFKTDSHLDIEQKSLNLLGFNDNSRGEQINIVDISSNQYAVKINQFSLHFTEINSLIEESQQMKRKIQLYENLLKDYQPPSASNADDNILISESQDSLIKKMKKYKQLKEENKKLKKLLQVQLENTQKVREQTQKTMKVLREEFDALVVEISKKQKGAAQSPYECHSNPPQLEGQNYQSNNKEKHSHSGGKHINIR